MNIDERLHALDRRAQCMGAWRLAVVDIAGDQDVPHTVASRVNAEAFDGGEARLPQRLLLCRTA
ncbi:MULTISPECIES: hypothetical protein [Bradyrhizobium]|uniref:hypothetical protein n=1 Tax=Bradyrhizobium TaxID=374 RepID=UPI001F0B4804|nr:MULTISPECIES: hypothetical protein [Bradyrhizobium]MCP1728871.1 hypothetical protein [Bradyrhizobium elkanii]MCS3452331.1 hypothetical protein [Bradyrhizobium elkanii]MCS3565566.1 hypothetical protein [Bradyrhizobium elkanii]MCS3572996.1 hypothetical protein [Bradyrhizobium elkanii]MCS3594311.1 hypothetical protein [Bradyrhizobium elkanii]